MEAGQKEKYKRPFDDTKNRIDVGFSRFEYSKVPSSLHLSDFYEFISLLDDRGINYIVFFPPLAPSINDYMRDYMERYEYIDIIKKDMLDNNVEFFDYTDIRALDSVDCEFIDGFHGGEIAYLRILKDLSNYNVVLKALLSDSIDKMIDDNSGNAAIYDSFMRKSKEIDFLGLGCVKE